MLNVINVASPYYHTFPYDSRGNLTGIHHPDGSSRTISYNEHGLSATVIDENGSTTGLQYDAYGQLARITAHDGSSRSLTADIVGRALPLRFRIISHPFLRVKNRLKAPGFFSGKPHNFLHEYGACAYYTLYLKP